MKKKIFLFLPSIINLTVINVVSCQNNTSYLNENIDVLNELENELKNYNWNPPSYNEENDKLKKMANNLQAIKLKISIATKLEYDEKTKFQDEFNNLENKIQTTKVTILPTLMENNLTNINTIFKWIDKKTIDYLNTIKTKFLSNNHTDFFLEKIKRSEIINTFFANFPIKEILLSNDHSQNHINNENHNTINSDILNFTNTILQHFYIMEQMKDTNQTSEEIIASKIKILHNFWIKLWTNSLNQIDTYFKSANIDFIK